MNAVDVFWFTLNIIFENQKLLMCAPLNPESREDPLFIYDDVSWIFSEACHHWVAFNIRPEIEATAGKEGEESGQLWTDKRQSSYLREPLDLNRRWEGDGSGLDYVDTPQSRICKVTCLLCGCTE